MKSEVRVLEKDDGVREAARSELPLLGSCLARAFEDDPVSEFFFPDPGSRLHRLDSFYRFAIRNMARNSVVYTDGALRGSAVWQPPVHPAPGTMRNIRNGLVLLAIARGAFSRVVRLGRMIQGAHIHEPHWYLSVLGTEPAHQGKGVGSALMEPALRRCDADGVLAYLESSKESNIPFYQRHGFRVTGGIRVPEGPTLWAMLREPRGR